MNRMHAKLKDDKAFKATLEFDESQNLLAIVFNEYLRLSYLEGDYQDAGDEGYLWLNDGLTHWHIDDDDEAFEIVSAIASGDTVFIENRNPFSLAGLKVMDKERFEKKQARYMAKDSLRIYTGRSIIKGNVRWESLRSRFNL